MLAELFSNCLRRLREKYARDHIGYKLNGGIHRGLQEIDDDGVEPVFESRVSLERLLYIGG
jgi:hypothetical protein